MDGGGAPASLHESWGFIPPMVRAWCMHGPFSTLSYSSAFEFLALIILVTTTLILRHVLDGGAFPLSDWDFPPARLMTTQSGWAHAGQGWAGRCRRKACR